MNYLLTYGLLLLPFLVSAQDPATLQGAWQTEGATLTFSGDFFSYAEFNEKAASFAGTRGGSWALSKGKITLTYEYHTWDSSQVGEEEKLAISLENDQLQLGDQLYTRLDNGTPGELTGPWLITGRMRDGEIREMPPGPRKTMKILSGTRFQWIAYHTGTKQFMGTGGGSYKTEEGNYVENIEFFSRDSSRVGASLSFEYDIIDGAWHHRGKSSKGNPIYEVWSLR